MFGFKKEPVKFCKDCKYYMREAYFNICEHPNLITTTTNIITGEVRVSRASCEKEREYEGLFIDYCGKKAKYFEPKERGNL